jgi:hypothetical protein
MKCQTNYNLRKRNSVMQYLISIVQQYRWWHTSPWRWLEEIKHWSLAWQRSLLFLLLQNRITASKHPFNSFSTCLTVCSNNLLPASVSPRLSVKSETIMALSLAWGSHYSACLGVLCFIERELLIMGAMQLRHLQHHKKLPVN